MLLDTNPNYTKAVKDILKEHNLNFDVRIKKDEHINAFSGFSTITITTGFMNHFPLNDEQDKLKILPILGHENTHKMRKKALIIEVIFSLFAFAGLFILLGGALVPVIQFYVSYLGLFLLICYLSRRDELEADKGGCELAKNTYWMIEFLKFMDKRKEKSYNLWDWYDELFRFHPNIVNRIKRLEKMKV